MIEQKLDCFQTLMVKCGSEMNGVISVGVAVAKVGATINTGVLNGAGDVGQILVLEEYALVVGDGRVATIGIKDVTNPKVMKPVSFEGDGRGQFGSHPGRLVAIGNMHFLLVSSHGVCVLKMTASA